jgi:hypothetical protein
VSGRLVICLYGLCFLLRCLQVFRSNLCVGRCGQRIRNLWKSTGVSERGVASVGAG